MFDKIMNLFTPSSLAMLRNGLSAIGVFLGLFGIAALSPASVDKTVQAAQALGNALGAVAAFVGLAIPLVMGVIAWFKANPLSQILNGSKAISANPELAKKVPLTTQLEMAKATDSLPAVVGVVAKPEIANAAPSNTIVTPHDAPTLLK